MAKVDYSYGVIPVIKGEAGYRYLIIHSYKGNWTFPKGHMEPNETDIQAAKRELYEETGITDADIKEDVSFYVHYVPKQNPLNFDDKQVKFFIGYAKDTKTSIPVAFQSEISEARWCTFEEANELFTYKEWKDLLREVNEYLTKKT